MVCKVREFLKTVLCSGIYTVLSYVFGWFDKKLLVTVLFFAFFVFVFAYFVLDALMHSYPY